MCSVYVFCVMCSCCLLLSLLFVVGLFVCLFVCLFVVVVVCCCCWCCCCCCCTLLLFVVYCFMFAACGCSLGSVLMWLSWVPVCCAFLGAPFEFFCVLCLFG